eukprot:scaffold89726_cov66-Phaeocystis_antarctica.AAC.4
MSTGTRGKPGRRSGGMQPGAKPVVAAASAGVPSRAVFGAAPQWCSSSGRLMRSHPRAMTSTAESPTMKTSDLSTPA